MTTVADLAEHWIMYNAPFLERSHARLSEVQWVTKNGDVRNERPQNASGVLRIADNMIKYGNYRA